MRKLLVLIGVVSVAWLSACSSTTEYKGVYAETSSRGPLDVPPGMDTPQDEGGQLPVMEEAKYFSEFTSQGGDLKDQEYLQTYKNIRFVRDGSLYWLEVKDSPQNVWPEIRAFFNRLGFKMILEQPRLGIMQTAWKENRVGIPTGWIASMLGKLYESELMDSYRIRMEFDEDRAITRIFMAHRGLREVVEGEEAAFTGDAGVASSKWIPRGSDPELEIEMLMRFMAYRGMDEGRAKEIIANTKPEQRSQLVTQDDSHMLRVKEVFARTWRHVGIALDRMGVAIEDRNRAAGIYYIRLPETFEIPASGFFSSSKKPSSYDYLLSLVDKGDATQVTVKARGEVGKDLPVVSKKILTDIQSNIL